MIIIIFK